MNSWKAYKYLVPLGARSGECVLRLEAHGTPGKIPAEMMDDLRCTEHARTIMMDDSALEQISDDDLLLLLDATEVWYYHESEWETKEERVPNFRTVVVTGDAFYDGYTVAGSEIIVEYHAPHLLSALMEETEFEYYYLLFSAEASGSHARDFLMSDEGVSWRLTSYQFTHASTEELERMYNE